MLAYLDAVGTAVPPTRIDQRTAANFLADALALTGPSRQRLLRVYEESGVSYRHTVLQDFLQVPGKFEFFANNATLAPAPGTQQRLQRYQQEALPLALQAVHCCLASVNAPAAHITHLITVSCTGLQAPGLDIELVEQLDLPPTTERTAINFMGCYAAFNALKVANYIVRAQPDAVVLVVAVELCTLHFHNRTDSDTLTANAIFGDGAAAALVRGAGHSTGKARLALSSFTTELAPQGKQEMAWQVGDAGFELRLSAYVPKLLQAGIGALVQRLLTNGNIAQVDHYALHPGGKRILQACEAALSLTPAQNKFSYEVLAAYGNLSSATVLFVLQRWLQVLEARNAGEHLLACAFGPGLTLEALLATVAV